MAIAVVFAAGLLAAALDLRFVIGGAPRSVEPNSLLVLDPVTGDTVKVIPLGARPGAVSVDDRAVSVAVAGRVVRIDPQTLARTGSGPTVPPPRGVRGAGLLWVTDSARNRLVALDPATGRVVRQETVGTEPVAVAIGFGAAWVANSGNGTITRVQIGGSKVEAIGLNDQPNAIAAGAGAVWIAGERGKVVIRLNPRDRQVDKTIRLANPPLAVAAGAGHVWVTIGD